MVKGRRSRPDLGPSEPGELLRIKSRSDPHGRVHSVRTLWNLWDKSHGPEEFEVYRINKMIDGGNGGGGRRRRRRRKEEKAEWG